MFGMESIDFRPGRPQIQNAWIELELFFFLWMMFFKDRVKLKLLPLFRLTLLLRLLLPPPVFLNTSLLMLLLLLLLPHCNKKLLSSTYFLTLLYCAILDPGLTKNLMKKYFYYVPEISDVSSLSLVPLWISGLAFRESPVLVSLPCLVQLAPSGPSSEAPWREPSWDLGLQPPRCFFLNLARLFLNQT